MNNRCVLIRWRRIATILNRARGPLPLAEIAAKLEVSRKTVERDMEEMRGSLALPIVATRRGHYLAEKVTLCAFCGTRADKGKP
jgi:predicted DNA-binding transcriptional regulator YafY